MTAYGPRSYKGPRKYIKEGTHAALALDNINKKKPPYRGIGASTNVNQWIAQMEKAKLIKVKTIKKYPQPSYSDGYPWQKEKARRTYGITAKGKKALSDIKKKGDWRAKR
jgi:hypothetical protein